MESVYPPGNYFQSGLSGQVRVQVDKKHFTTERRQRQTTKGGNKARNEELGVAFIFSIFISCLKKIPILSNKLAKDIHILASAITLETFEVPISM